MALEDAIMVPQKVQEWIVEKTMVVQKYIHADSAEEAEALATLDDDFERVMQTEVTWVKEA